jgi:spore coat polysaccharide biosynthesis protein SpsF
MKDLGGHTVLARVVNRSRRASLVDQLVVATSVDTGDDIIVEECHRHGVACFRGSEADVLDRYYRAAQYSSADVIVRITADCPLIDSDLVDDTIRRFVETKADYASNSLVRTYPRGLDTEVFTMQALARAWTDATEPYQRSHVTPYLYQTTGLFRTLAVTGETDYSQYRWTLDTPDDLKLVREIYARFEDRDTFGWRDVLQLFEREPSLADINSQVCQKTLQEG